MTYCGDEYEAIQGADAVASGIEEILVITGRN